MNISMKHARSFKKILRKIPKGLREVSMMQYTSKFSFAPSKRSLQNITTIK